ncbi:calcyclin-binding protein [Diretmus argenteus]
MGLPEEIKELEAVLEDLEYLITVAKETRVRGVLKKELDNVKKEIAAKHQQIRKATDPDALSKAACTVPITNYGWDQSEKFVKIYLTLKDVHKIPSENVEVNFTERSFSVLVKDLDGKNHQKTITNLLCPIDVKDSYKKIKTDMVLVMCKKHSQAKKWECLTQTEKQSKDKDKPTMDENADPSEGLMNMLKKIYTEGDDEMKRTINKAWSESQEKKLKGEDMNMDF